MILQCITCKLDKEENCFYKDMSRRTNRYASCISCEKTKRSGTCAKCGARTSSKKAMHCKPCSAPRGENHYLWQGGRTKNKDGYIFLTNLYGNPLVPRKDGKIFEHQFVMAQKLGRPLTRGENVHHKNGDRADNRIENLELWVVRQPVGQRVEDQIKWAKELLRLYEPEALND